MVELRRNAANVVGSALVCFALALCLFAGAALAAGHQLTVVQSLPITSLETAGMQPQGYPAGYEAAFSIYNGLVRFTAAMEIVPDLATEWSVSPDGLTWTFRLRRGVTFHDGTPFDADAVLAHFRRMMDPAQNPGAIPLWRPIASVAKADDFTVRITTSAPYGGLLNVLAHGSGLIPSPAAVEKFGDAYKLNPVGTGPYRVESFDVGSRLVLVRNDAYYGPAPAFARKVFQYVPDAATRVAALQAGQADVATTVPVEYLAAVIGNPQLAAIVRPGLQTFGIGFNLNNPVLQDKRLRHALNHAIDKAAIVNVLFRGQGSVLDSPLAPGINGHVALSRYEFDLTRARALLAEAGYRAGSDGILRKDGQPLALTLLTPEGAYPNDVQVAEVIQAQLRQVGVQVTLKKVERAAFWDGLKVPVARLDHDLVLWGFNPSHGDAYLHLEALFRANAGPEVVPVLWNHVWYANPEVDRLLDAAREATDPHKRAAALAEAQRIVWDEAPYIWLYTNTIITATRADVKDVAVLPVVFTIVRDARR